MAADPRDMVVGNPSGRERRSSAGKRRKAAKRELTRGGAE
jgi:hypothetical protein